MTGWLEVSKYIGRPLREKTTFGTDDGGNVHKLNETKKLNQAMVPVTLIQGLGALTCIILL